MADVDWDLKWDMLVADAWDDADLKKRLLSKPEDVFRERGINLPAGTKIKVVESTSDTNYFVIPQQPSEEEMSAEELEAVAGGHHHHHHGCGCGGCGGCGCGGCRGCSGGGGGRGCSGGGGRGCSGRGCR